MSLPPVTPPGVYLPPAPLPPSSKSEGTLLSAVRGPVMLIVLGVLLAVDQNGRFGFERTWPALLIVFGVFKLLEHAGSRGHEA